MKKLLVLLVFMSIVFAGFAIMGRNGGGGKYKRGNYHMHKMVQGLDSTDVYFRQWNRIISFLEQQKPKSAAELIDSVYEVAKRKNDKLIQLKAELYYLLVVKDTSESADRDLIALAEKHIQSSTFPYQAVWQSVAAQLYWNYYNNNRYRFLERSHLAEDTTADVDQWDVTRINNKIASLYQSSISRLTELKDINIQAFGPILTEADGREYLRPTLLDLLAHRAIEYYEDEDRESTQAGQEFLMNDEAVFAGMTKFVHHQFTSSDTGSMHFKALQLYQTLIDAHLNDDGGDALLDLNLHRLEFANKYAVVANKTKLYNNALSEMAQSYPDYPFGAMAEVDLVQNLVGYPDGLPEDDNDTLAKAARPDLSLLAKRLEKVIKKFLDEDCSAKAKMVLEAINHQSNDFNLESVVLPGKPSKILIRYRNSPTVYIKVYKIKSHQFFEFEGERQIPDSLNDGFEALNFKVSLPSSKDHYAHTTEVKIDALPPGQYYMLASARHDFIKTNNSLHAQFFQVSSLAYLSCNEDNVISKDFFVIDRQSGRPISGADVFCYSPDAPKKTMHGNTNKDGAFSIKKFTEEYDYFNVIISKGRDSLCKDGMRYEEGLANNNYSVTKTYFFTDRAIYRPGQTVYYKGIIAKVASDQRKAEVVPNMATTVKISGRSAGVITKQSLKTNDFGSFTGTFKIPEGIASGEITISNESGYSVVRVEEYKRPKFQVIFDTIKSGVLLNELVSVTGSVQAFAGNMLDGVNVKYTVQREAIPYYDWFGRATYGEVQVISSGKCITDATGKFKIEFPAIPDESIDKSKLPVFTYQVAVDITDINGETHSALKEVKVGYASVKITDKLPELANPKQLMELDIKTETLDDVYQPGNIRLIISKLKQPSVIYRDRLWGQPDQYVMDEASFRKDFGNDPFKNENNKSNWPVESVVYDRTVESTPEKIKVPVATWAKNGWYLVEMSTYDKNHTLVTSRKFVEVWDKNNSGILSDALVVIPQQTTSQPGEQPEINIVSAYDKAVIWSAKKSGVGATKVKHEDMNGQPLLWKRKLEENDRGGIALSYCMMKDNRLYTRTAKVEVPWTNKQLDLVWETHRDKLLPGEQETWTLTVKGSQKDKVAAEFMGALYDASLDEFAKNDWYMGDLYPNVSSETNWNADINMEYAKSIREYLSYGDLKQDKDYQGLILLDRLSGGGGRFGYKTYSWGKKKAGAYKVALDEVGVAAPAAAPPPPPPVASLRFTPPVIKKDAEVKEEDGLVSQKLNYTISANGSSIVPQSQTQETAIRKNLNETAFFYPQLRTDAQGNIKFQFTMPEALTEWKFIALAHTKDMAYGNLEGKVKTQKDLMVFPNLPRFLRQGDDMVISTKISNLSTKNETGTANLELLDAATLKPITSQFMAPAKDLTFAAKPGQSATASWHIHIPDSWTEPVVVRISARTGDFTDGEENTLPVVSNRTLVTETQPLWVNGSNSKSFTIDKLLKSNSSNTLTNYGLTVEYTSNPAWYAILALPYLMEFPHECAEQTFNRYYANALAAHIAHLSPNVERIFNQWQKQDTGALLSNLDKNQELKSALLQETPWVMEAKNEKEQRHRISKLFEINKLAQSQSSAIRKLADLQLPSGGFGWFKGSREADRYITQYILTGIGHLEHLGVGKTDASLSAIRAKALNFIDNEVRKEYEYFKTNKIDLTLQNINREDILYLYMRSLHTDIPIDAKCREAYDYYKKQVATYQASFNSYMRGMIALTLFRAGDKAKANDIIGSLREVAHHSEEMGMYWHQNNSYWWYDAPVEEQALLIECFSEITKDQTSLDAMKLWLLKQKQTQSWATTKATADACFALLLQGSNCLKNEPQVKIQLGNETINSATLNKEKGTGYFKVKYEGAKVVPAMGNIKVDVKGNDHSTSWGAAYWQYFENLDKISSAATGISVQKDYYIEQFAKSGRVLKPVNEQNHLKIGDKVIIVIKLSADRDMDYVHLKDMRASCFEPINVLNEYKYKDGLGYYESTKDVSSNFFISHMAKGKYVFEYPVYVTHTGDFSGGIATFQCMYAPEFSSHSKGVRLRVE